MKKIITICAFAACLTGCDDLFEPAIENNLGLEYMYENSQYAEGILANAYTRIPCAGYSFNDVATDDAVSNDAENSWRKIASGKMPPCIVSAHSPYISVYVHQSFPCQCRQGEMGERRSGGADVLRP